MKKTTVKRIITGFLAAITIASSALLFAGCGSNNTQATENASSASSQQSVGSIKNDPNTLAGSYKCVDTVGLSDSNKQVALDSLTLVIDENNKGVLTSSVTSIECQFDPSTMEATPTSSKGKGMPYTFDGTNLSLGNDHPTYIFVKIG